MSTRKTTAALAFAALVALASFSVARAGPGFGPFGGGAGGGGAATPAVFVDVILTGDVACAHHTTITNWTEITDTDGAFAAGVFTAPKSGVYSMTTQQRYTNAVAVLAQLRWEDDPGGVPVDNRYWGNFAANSQKASILVKSLALESGDKIYFECTGAATLQAATWAGEPLTYANITFIAP